MNFALNVPLDKDCRTRGMIKLELKLQELTLKEFTLQDGDNLSIGRHSDNDIVVKDMSASRHHASFERKGENLIVRDKGSINGIVVNGEKVQSAELKNGDVICIGVNHHLVATIASTKKGTSILPGESDLNAITGLSSLDLRLEWQKNSEGTWWTLAEAALGDKQFDKLEGVYVIWYEDQKQVALRVGQGHIRDCIVKERNNDEMWEHTQQYPIYVTWAQIGRKYREVIAKHIAEAAKPEVKRSHLKSRAFVVNLPWYDEEFSQD